MSAYDSVRVNHRVRVRVYVELTYGSASDWQAVMVQLLHDDGDRWGPSVTMTPSDARAMAAGLSEAAERYERARDK